MAIPGTDLAPINLTPSEAAARVTESGTKNWRDGFSGIFGANADKIDYSTREIDNNGNVKMTAMDTILGRSQEELNKGYTAYRTQQLRPITNQISATSSALGRSGLTDTDIATMTQEDLTTKQTELGMIEQAQGSLLGLKGGSERLAGLGDNPTLQALQGAVATQIDENEQARVTDARTYAEKVKDGERTYASKEGEKTRDAQRESEKRQIAAGDARLTAQLADGQAARDQQHKQFLATQLEAAQARQDQTALQMAQFNMQMEEARRRDERQDKRDAKAEKMQMIAMITKGLTAMGQGFAY